MRVVAVVIVGDEVIADEEVVSSRRGVSLVPSMEEAEEASAERCVLAENNSVTVYVERIRDAREYGWTVLALFFSLFHA